MKENTAMNFMHPKSSIFSPGWTNLVFEELNQQYGAYILRRLHRHMLGTAILINLFVIAGFIFATYLYNTHYVRSGQLPTTTLSGEIELTTPPPLTLVPVVPEQVKSVDESRPKEITNPVVVAKLPDNLAMPDQIPDELSNLSTQSETSNTEGYVNPTELGMSGLESTTILNKNIIIPDVFPSFKGGPEALSSYLKKNIRYPELAKFKGTSGVVYVAFTVDAIGSVTDIEISHGIGNGCDEEAIRVIKSMPDWNPGRQAGMAVPVRFNLPIKFSILK